MDNVGAGQRGSEEEFSREIGEKEKRRLKARGIRKRSEWAGMGLFGMVGWSVVVPALLGTALGVWLDKKYPQHFSWTLTFLMGGLITGCVIAWNWVAKENNEMHKNTEDEK